MSTIRSVTPAPAPITLLNVVLADSGGTNVLWMCDDRTTLLGASSAGNAQAGNTNILKSSTDDGVTWTTRRTFGSTARIEAARQLANGEVLVTLRYGGGTGEVWVSAGWPANPGTATWTRTLVLGGQDVYVRGQWGASVAPAGSARAGWVFLAEYGTQTAADNFDNRAVRAYASSDHGATWTVIFNLLDLYPATVGIHTHGIAYDQHSDRVFITHGDGAAGRYSAVVYSDDVFTDPAAATWTPAPGTLQQSNTYQAVSILPLESCVLLGTDGFPTGVFRIPKTSRKGLGTIATATLHQGGTGSIAAGMQPFRAGFAGAPALMPTVPTSTSMPSNIVATMDGETFVEVWRDTVTPVAWAGVQQVVGPTLTGKIIAAVTGDARQANTTRLTAELVTGP